MKSLVVILLISIVAMHSPSHAMGEGERILGWVFNWNSQGTFLAELDAQRAIIQQELQQEFLRERISIEAQQKKHASEVLNKKLAKLGSLIESQQKLENSCDKAQLGLNEVIAAVETFYASNTTQYLKISNLAQTFRQEAELKNIDIRQVQDLVNVCEQYESATRRRIAVCRLISLFDTQDYATFTEITPSEMSAQVEKFVKNNVRQSRLCKEISTDLMVFTIQKDAIAVRLKSLQEKK